MQLSSFPSTAYWRDFFFSIVYSCLFCHELIDHCCSIAKSCPTLCNLMDYSMWGFPVLHYLCEFAQTHAHWVSDAIQPSHHLLPPLPVTLNFPQHLGLFQSQLFASGGQKIGASASASVLPMYIQGWFPLGLTRLISLLSKGLESSPATQFKNINSLMLSLLYAPTLTSIHD